MSAVPTGPANRTHYFPTSRYEPLLRERVIDSALRGGPALVVCWGGSGAGKSVAAAQIAVRLSGGDTPAVWVRFGADRSDAAGAWQAILQALVDSGLVPEDSELGRMRGSELPAGVEPLTRAMRAVGRGFPERLVLVLDDLHLVGDGAFEADLLEMLETHRMLSVVVASRSRHARLVDIDARMRVPVREITARELQFGRDEISSLLARRLPELDSAARDRLAVAIERGSGGWPLAAHAAIVERESGRGAAAHRVFVRNHVSRMLAHAGEHGREVLCATALFDEISSGVVARMFQVDEERALEMLEGSSETGFGYWESDDGTRWYRHHDLIREELRRRAEIEVGAVRLRTLYRRAAVVFEPIRPFQAVRAALQAEAWDLLEPMLLARSFQRLGRREDLVGEKWLRDIPSAVRDRHPVIAAFALIDEFAYPRGRFDTVINGFKMLTGSRLAEESEKRGLPGAVASALRMVAARLSGNQELALRMADRFEIAIEDFDEATRMTLKRPLWTGTTQAAVTYLHASRFDDVERVLLRCDFDEEETPLGEVHTLALGAFSDAWRGWMLRLGERIERCESQETPMGWRTSYTGSGYRIAAAVQALEAGDPERAENHLDALVPHEPTIEHWPYLEVLRALVLEERTGSRSALDSFEWRLQQRRRRFATLPAHRRMLAEFRARLQWRAGMVVRGSKPSSADLGSAYAALSRGDDAAARMIVAALQREPGLAGAPRRRTELLLVQAEAERRNGDSGSASDSANAAAGLMREHGLSLPRLAVTDDALHRLAELAPSLAGWVEPTGTAAGVGDEIRALSAAELRALAATVRHGTVPAAAQALFLSTDTVKSHIRRAYRKLGVNSREEAVRMAIEAGMFEWDGGDPDLPRAAFRGN